MKARMRRLWFLFRINETSIGEPDASWLGVMTSTHGKPCSCSMFCGNRRHFDGPSIGERRRGIDGEPSR